MRFKEGSRVEVLRKKKESLGSWFPAKILSRTEDIYMIRYELCLTKNGEPVIENVHKERIRPCPSPCNEGESWALGDIAEAFDLRSWEIAKIEKILNNNWFVVRLLDSGELKKVHVSNLRVRQAWRNDGWISLGKTIVKKQNIQNLSEYTNFVNSGADRLNYEETNQKLNFHNNNNKRKSALEASEYYAKTKRVSPFFNQKKIIDENVECSVASCSNGVFDDSKEESAANVHELELHAYKSTVQALYASGPLNWEQELILTDLRRYLHVSNEEHLIQLKNLLSA